MNIDIFGEIKKDKSQRFKKKLVHDYSFHSFNRKIILSDYPLGMIPRSTITAMWTPSTQNLRVSLEGQDGKTTTEPFEKRIQIKTTEEQ